MPKPVRSNIYTYQVGNPKSINRSYNFINARDGGQGPAFFWNNYWSSFRPGPPPPYVVTNFKSVAILEDERNAIDTNVKNTLIYYFTNYNSIYQPFNIVITNPDVNEYLTALQNYYDLGYRYFIVTSHTAILYGIIDWFNNHPDAVGYSNYAQSTIFSNIPKNIYTLNPSIDSKLELFSNSCIIPYDIVYFVYNPNPTLVTNVDAYNYIKNKCASLGKTFVDISFTSSTQITQESINNMMTNVVHGGQNASLITSLLTLTNNFYNAFYSTTPQYNYKFYELSIVPTFVNPQSKSYFVNNLFVESLSQANLNASYLWEVGYETIGFTNYAATVLNCLNMVYGSQKNIIIADQLPSHSDNLYFDYVFKYLQNRSVAVYEYILKNGVYLYNPDLIYYGNDNGETFVSDVPNPITTPVVVKPIPAPSGPKKKAIALLELTNGYVTNDRAMQKTLMYYLTVTSIFEPISIYNTDGNLNTTLNMLETYYNQGIRIFIGFSRSTIVSGVLDWFNSHPDAIGISTTSSANSLSVVKKNIYRLQIVDSYILDSISIPLQNTINSSGKIYYIYTVEEQAAQEVLDILNSTYGASNIIGYPVLKDNSNLTQQDLINFFINTNNVSANDSVVVYLIDGNQRQIYVDYFFGELSIPANQYDILAVNFPKINLETTTLNKLYNVLTIENITKSQLWNDGLEYLGDTNFSSNSLNALYMATSFVNNYDVLSLASYDSCIQFTEFNDCKFGSVASYVYNDGLFVYNFIYSVDPIYGQLNFTKIAN